MNKNRLIKVAEFLEELQEKKDYLKKQIFNFGDVVWFLNTGAVEAIANHEVNEDNLFDCDSIFCACGLLPIIDPESGISWYSINCGLTYDIRDTKGNKGYVAVASNYFDILMNDARNLFTPCDQSYIKNWGDANVCRDDATAKEVADAIRHFIEIKEQAA